MTRGRFAPQPKVPYPPLVTALIRRRIIPLDHNYNDVAKAIGFDKQTVIDMTRSGLITVWAADRAAWQGLGEHMREAS